MTRLLLVPFTVALLALAGCGSEESGGGDAVDARTWAASVCGSAREWVDETEARAGAFQTDELTSLDEARTMMVELLDGAVADGEEAVGEIEAAGTPDVEGGEEARDAFAGAVRRNVEELRARRDEFEQLDPGDPEQFQRDYEAVFNRMAGERMGFDEAFEADVDPALGEAFEETEDCRTLREL